MDPITGEIMDNYDSFQVITIIYISGNTLIRIKLCILPYNIALQVLFINIVKYHDVN